MFAGANAMVISATPQLKPKLFMKLFGLMLGICMLIYVLSLPHITNFIPLGILLFVLMFTQRYFLTGFPYVIASLSIMGLSISNGQTYDFNALINADLFNILFILVLIGCWYAPLHNPKKAIGKLLFRFQSCLGYCLNTDTQPYKELSFLKKIQHKFIYKVYIQYL